MRYIGKSGFVVSEGTLRVVFLPLVPQFLSRRCHLDDTVGYLMVHMNLVKIKSWESGNIECLLSGAILDSEGAHMGLSIPGGWVNEGQEAEMKVVLSTNLRPNEQELDGAQASSMKACPFLLLLGPRCERVSRRVLSRKGSRSPSAGTVSRVQNV
jgi:hypothetical protein